MRDLLATLFVMTIFMIPKISFACYEPFSPYIPDGYYAESYKVQSAQEKVNSYLSEVQYYIDCLSDEISNLRDKIDNAQYEAQNVIDQWESAVSAYNSR
mgnify:CR=1 FL=1